MRASFKKSSKIGLLILFVAVFSCSSKEEKKMQTEQITLSHSNQQNDLPGIELTFFDGTTINLKSLQKKFVLVLFLPDCNYCQNEADTIQSRLNYFKDYSLYFASSSPISEIRQFSQDHKLANQPNIRFGWTSTESVLNTYGAISVPSIYIYSDEGRLIKKFNGKFDFEKVLNSL